MDLKKLRRNAFLTIALIILLSILFGFQSSELRFDYEFENFFPEDHPETEFYEEHKERFGSENDIILIGVRNEGGIYEEDFLHKVDSLTQKLREIEHIMRVRSPTELSYPIRDPLMGGVYERPYLRIEEPEHYATDSARIHASERVLADHFSKDGHSLSLILRNAGELSKEASDSLANAVRSTVEGSDFDELHMTGRIVAQQHYVEVMQREFVVFISVAFAMVLAFLLLNFRTWWGVLIPLAVVLLSVLWTLGIMGILGEPINLLLIILPTILFVVGTSDVVHLLSKFQEEQKKGCEKLEALQRAFRGIGTATFLTSLTTAIGFSTLLMAPIPPIRDFGLFAAMGVFIAFILAFTLLPSTLFLLKAPKLERSSLAHPVWNRVLYGGFHWVLARKGQVLFGSSLIIALSIWGVAKIDLNNHMLEDLKEGDPQQQSFRFFEKEFAGVRPFELSIRVKDSGRSVLERPVVQAMDTIEDYLKEQHRLETTYSPVYLFEQLRMAEHGGDPEEAQLPGDPQEFERLQGQIEDLKHREGLRSLVTEDGQWARVSGRMPDLGSKKVRALNDSLERFIATRTDTSLFDHKLTGSAHLIDLNNEQLSSSMLEGLMIAFLAIAVIVLLTFRSLKMVLAVLIPNMLPLLMVGGIMGWVGIPLKVSTSVIFTIAFGIAVDDTIHFTNRLKLELNRGKDLHDAIERTYISTGRAILLTTLILCTGFVSLVGSDFLGAFYVGLLVTLSLFFAVLADLTLLPVLLLRFFRKRELNR